VNYLLIIRVDTNDADYIESSNEIGNVYLNHIMPVIEAIKAFKPYKGQSSSGREWTHDNNFPYSEYSRADLGEKTAKELYGHIEGFDAFLDFLPYGENGFHSIESIICYEIGEKKELL
jgi:hypothetical protein